MEQNKDRHLGSPGEANTDKHINFLEAEERTNSTDSADENRFGRTKEDEQRQEEWKRGLEEGRKEAGKTSQE